MSMTKREFLAKVQLTNELLRQGYSPYAKILQLFDINLTKDPKTIGYMVPGKYKIVINEQLILEQAALVIRHEILHEALKHNDRLQQHWQDKYYKDPKNPKSKGSYNYDWDHRNSAIQNIANIAADYEISNLGYTDRDKKEIKNIRINGNKLAGLVTDIDAPDMVNDDVDTMFDKLINNHKQDLEDMEKMEQAIKDMLDNLPQIGDIGDQEIQDLEEIEREANSIDEGEYRKQLGMPEDPLDEFDDLDDDSTEGEGGEPGDETNKDEAKPSNSGKRGRPKKQDKQDDLEKEAGKIADKASDLVDDAEEQKEKRQEAEDKGQIFKDEQDALKNANINKRIEAIKRAFNKLGDELVNTAKRVKAQAKKDDEEKAKAKEVEKYKNNPLYKIVNEIFQFFSNYMRYSKGNTWRRPNKKYDDSGIARKGTTRQAPKLIPEINVYFDRSGSWDDPEKTEIGRRIVAALGEFQRKGKIKINLFYFSNNVHTVEKDALAEGGTNGHAVHQHIMDTQPDHVIILTDSDCNQNYSQKIRVDGAVWFIFEEGQSPKMVEAIQGTQLTKEYFIRLGR